MPGHTYSGASGKLYSYLFFSTEDLAALPMQAGNYIFAFGDGARTPIFIEATNGVRAAVMRQAMAEWRTARTVFGAELVLIHVDPALDMAARQSEKEDLIACYHPPMNPMPDPAQ